MYRWYRDAARCYVFLHDVTASTVEPSQHNSWESQLKASDWFTRGWTLQELLAPKSVEFYSSDGILLGNKESLKQLIHIITGIPVNALQGRPLQDFGIPDRMAWAHARRTTQPEDFAYCQIGILNVHLPLDYGEGRVRALGRLREEVEAVDAAPCSIPLSPERAFFHHQSNLTELEAILAPSTRTTNMVITGEIGIGKSRLALELAHRVRRKDRNCAIFWIDASDTDSLDQAYAEIAQRLELPGSRMDIRRFVRNRLSEINIRPWLLIFDNADDEKLRSSGISTPLAARLADFLPKSPVGSIIVTTTNSCVTKQLSAPTVVELTMSEGTAEQVLLSHLVIPPQASERQELKLLVRELAGLPLAIVQAAAYINNRNTKLGDYRALMIEQSARALKLSDALPDREAQECDVKNPVITTLLITLDHIHRTHPLAADVSSLAACVDRKDILLELLEPALPREREDAIGILKAYALVMRRPAESSFELHRLTQVAIRRWLNSQGLLTKWVSQAVQRLHDIFPHTQEQNELGYRSKWRRLLPHVMCVLSYCPYDDDNPVKANLMWKCALALEEDGRNDEAEELFRRVKDFRVRNLGPENAHTLTSMSNLAYVYHLQRRWKDAEELNLQVRDVRVRVLGPEHTYTLHSIGNLAATYENQGRLKEAETLELQVMEARKRLLGSMHPDTFHSMSALTVTYLLQDRLKEAKEMEVQVLELRKRKLGPEHPDTLISMSNLASIYARLYQFTDAVWLIMQVRKIRMRLLGVEHPSTLISMCQVADLYFAAHRWDEALGEYVHVAITRRRVLGEEHPLTLETMGDVAAALWGSGHRTRAMEHMEKNVRIGQRTLSADDRNLVSWSTTLADWKAQGAEAREAVVEAEVEAENVRGGSQQNPGKANSSESDVANTALTRTG